MVAVQYRFDDSMVSCNVLRIDAEDRFADRFGGRLGKTRSGKSAEVGDDIDGEEVVSGITRGTVMPRRTVMISEASQRQASEKIRNVVGSRSWKRRERKGCAVGRRRGRRAVRGEKWCASDRHVRRDTQLVDFLHPCLDSIAFLDDALVSFHYFVLPSTPTFLLVLA